MKKKAFTLIELLTVIVIIAIIATIGVFTITKIIDNTRIKSLNETATAVKKAASLYAASNELPDGTTTIDLTPGTGAEKSIIDLSKDPWGDNYVKVLADIIKSGDNPIAINIYIC